MDVLERFACEVGSLGRSVLALLLPPLCVVCGASLGGSDRWICPPCALSVATDRRPRSRTVGLGGRELRIWYVLDYTAAVATLIREMKYADKPGLADLLARLVWRGVRGEVAGDAAVVPVPLHPARLRERGYNQSEILGRKLARLAGSPVFVRALRRTRNTAAQATLDRGTRLKNVAGSFRAWDVSGIGSKRVMLVDDVVTTGSTLGECAQALYDCGLEDVQACAIASRDS
jgi:ComF family protein